MFEELEARRARLDAYRPFDAETQRRLDKVLVPFFIYNSNAIEGNTLSLGATIAIVEDGRLPGGAHSEREYLEVEGQQAAHAFLRRAIEEGFVRNERLVREFHQLLTSGLDERASHVDTPAAMQSLMEWLSTAAGQLHPVELAAQFHYRFILIHPFLDGNGRAVRLLTNLVLAQSGYVMAPFRFRDRRDVYLAALRAVDTSVPIDELGPDHPGLNFFPFVSYLEQELPVRVRPGARRRRGADRRDARGARAASRRARTGRSETARPVLGPSAVRHPSHERFRRERSSGARQAQRLTSLFFASP